MFTGKTYKHATAEGGITIRETGDMIPRKNINSVKMEEVTDAEILLIFM